MAGSAEVSAMQRTGYYRMQAALVEAAQLQRKALKLTRYASLTPNGGEMLSEAADALLTAADRLREVSVELFRARVQAQQHADEFSPPPASALLLPRSA